MSHRPCRLTLRPFAATSCAGASQTRGAAAPTNCSSSMRSRFRSARVHSAPPSPHAASPLPHSSPGAPGTGALSISTLICLCLRLWTRRVVRMRHENASHFCVIEKCAHDRRLLRGALDRTAGRSPQNQPAHHSSSSPHCQPPQLWLPPTTRRPTTPRLRGLRRRAASHACTTRCAWRAPHRRFEARVVRSDAGCVAVRSRRCMLMARGRARSTAQSAIIRSCTRCMTGALSLLPRCAAHRLLRSTESTTRRLAAAAQVDYNMMNDRQACVAISEVW